MTLNGYVSDTRMSSAFFLQYLESKTSSDLKSFLQRLYGRESGRDSLEVEGSLEEEGGMEGGRGNLEVEVGLEEEGGMDGSLEGEEKGRLVWRVITTVAGYTQEELYQVPSVLKYAQYCLNGNYWPLQIVLKIALLRI